MQKYFLPTISLALSFVFINAQNLQNTQKPNVIFILVDDLGYGDLSCYGQEKFETQEIDRLATEGIRFTQHYSGSTVCAPSRCALMTGKHTGKGLVNKNYPGDFPLPENTLTVARIFKEKGYSTALIGKWGLGNPTNSGSPLNQGFDYFYGYHSQMQAHGHYPKYLWKNNKKIYLEGNKNKNRKQHSQSLFTKEAKTFIKRNATKPFFLHITYAIPHADLDAKEDWLSKFDGKYPEKPFRNKFSGYRTMKNPRATFAAMISQMDSDVGEINQLLKELGIDKNTLLIFTSDNGAHAEGGADPEFFNSTGGLRGIKRDLYEGGIRVPFIAKWPYKIEANTKSDCVTAFWDFMPTVTDLLNVPLTEDLSGISYLPALLGEPQDNTKQAFYWKFKNKQALRQGNWKILKINNEIELYDLSNDAYEKNNLVKKYPDIAKKLIYLMENEGLN